MQTPDNQGREVWTDTYFPDEYQGTNRHGSIIDAAWLRGALFRQRWLIGGTIIVALLVGLVITLLATPIYQANASVRLSPFGNYIVEGQDLSQQVYSSNEIESYMRTQARVIESRSLAAVVAENLNVGTLNDLLAGSEASSPPTGQMSEEVEASLKQDAVPSLQGGVSVEVPGDSRIITIFYSSEDPLLAAQIANAYAQAYKQSDTRDNVARNAYAREYLLDQIDEVRERLQVSERAANTFARNAGIITPETTGSDSETGQTIIGANLSNINQTVAQARASRIAAQERWQAVRSIPASQLPEVQESPVVQSLTSQKAQLLGQLTNLQQRYNDQFPEIVDVRSRIDLLEEQIAQAGANIKAGIRSQYIIAREQEEALAGELDAATQDALVEQDRKVEYSGLERESLALRSQLEDLLNRYNAVSTAANVQTGEITILDNAQVPIAPVSPDILQNMILSLVIGIALAGGLGLVREIFVDQFRSVDDLDARLGLPVFGMTPYVKSEDINSEGSDQFSSLMEAYSSIRSTIDYTVPRDGAVVQFTSSQSAEGKSLTAVIVAELFARLGRRTLLIDGDLRKPNINSLLGLEVPDAGLVEVLMGHATFEDAKITDVHENLEVLPVAGIPPNPVELLSSRRFREFIDERREEYSMIIIDSTPVLGLADAPEMSQSVDATIFIVEANRTSFAQAKTALRRLTDVGAHLVGGVLTKYRALEAGSDYGYQYQYYRYGRDE